MRVPTESGNRPPLGRHVIESGGLKDGESIFSAETRRSGDLAPFTRQVNPERVECREDSWSCGAGMSVSYSYPDSNEWERKNFECRTR